MRQQQAESRKRQRMRLSKFETRLHTGSAAPVSVLESISDENNKDHGNTEGTQKSFESEDPALVPHATF